VFEKQFSLYDVYGADEAFVTGTFAGLCPVREVDGRVLGHPLTRDPQWHGAGPMVKRLTGLYQDLARREATRRL
jgi:branched-chain amino acid aminotransferase